MRRRLTAIACCTLALVPVGTAGSTDSPRKRTAAELHARCLSRPFPGPRYCAAEWAARPSSHPSSTWYVPEPWLRAKLARIRSCESGGRYDAATGNGFYGAYQWVVSTWHSQGGRGMPNEASAPEQDFRAAKLFRAAGPRPWPVCGYR